MLVYLYRRRLREHFVQELLAGLGIVVAVAFVLAVSVANGSIAGSATEVVRAVAGPASLQLRARGTEGFDESLITSVKRLPGVQQTGPLLEQAATVIGPGGRREAINLAGTDIRLAVLDGLARTLPFATLSPGGIGLSRTSAESLGIAKLGTRAVSVTVIVRGRASSLKVSAVLGSEAAGALSQARVGVMPLSELQQLAGLPGRITRILVKTKPGEEAIARKGLLTLAGGRLTVTSAQQDVTLLHQALKPSDQASALFAVICVLLGFLFAFNAMLLTIPERRRRNAGQRLFGVKRSAILQVTTSQALCLGVLASLVGLAGGYVLSVSVFHQSPAYLTPAFILGSQTIVGVQSLLLSFIGGVLATCLASLILLADLRGNRALDVGYSKGEAPSEPLTKHIQRRLLVAAVVLLALVTVLLAVDPAAALAACIVLALATVLAVPLILAGVLHVADLFARRRKVLALLGVAVTSLRSTTLRSLALAATGALALFGSVALGGARDDLLRGIADFTSHYVAAANLWIVNPGDNQAVSEFAADHDAARIAQIKGVANVRTFQGSFLDIGNRRVWVLAWQPNTGLGVLQGQLIDGRMKTVLGRIKEGNWITVSQQIATQYHVGVGDTLTIPTPTGNLPFRVAAMTTNFGWSPGAILMSTDDYSRAWASSAPSALGINLLPGADLQATRSAIQRELGTDSGLEILTARARAASINGSASEGLRQLGEISGLLILAAILAMAAALGSSIWQRRVSLAGRRLEGVPPARLRRLLLSESLLLLGAGCLTGAGSGIYGQLVIDTYLKRVTGFTVAGTSLGIHQLEIVALVLITVLLIAATLGWFASRVSPMLALEE